MDAFAIAVSMGLQYGVPLEVYVSKFSNMIFEPNGITDDPDIRITQSLVDYIARRLAIDYLDVESRQALGIKTTAERIEEVNGTGPSTASQPAPASTGAATSADASSAAVTEGESAKGQPAGPAGEGRSAGEGADLASQRARVHTRDVRGRRPLLLHLRRPHAPGRLLLRLRVLRHHERM